MKSIILKADSINLTEEEFFNLCQQNKELSFERDKNNNIYIMSPTGSQTSFLL